MNSWLPHDKFNGVSLIRDVAGGFLLKELSYDSNSEVPKHWHETPNFCMALKGSCREVFGRTNREFHPWTWNFLPAGNTHSVAVSNVGMSSFSVEVPARLTANRGDFVFPLEAPVFDRGGMPAWLLLRIYQEFHQLDEVSNFVIEGMVLELFAEVARRNSRSFEGATLHWLDTVKDLLHAHFADALSLSAIAAKVDVHPCHLAREFRRANQCTLGEYVRRLRIESACRELMLTSTPVAQIALAAGFSDQSHLARIFRRHLGMSPSKYRSLFSKR